MPRAWPRGSRHTCPRCESSGSLVGRDDLSVETTLPGGAAVVYCNIRGAECSNCGAQYLEPDDADRLEVARAKHRVDFEAKVSRIGSGTVGTYWPKDVVRLLDLRPGRRIYIEVLSDKHALLRFGDDA